jgi:pilus assembly protein CpaD
MAKQQIGMLTVLVVLSACMPEMDMQGVDPKDFYADHPIKNQVETRHLIHTLQFNRGKDHLSADDIDDLQMALRKVSPMSTESVTVLLPKSQMNNSSRKQYVSKLLRSMGYPGKLIRFESSKEILAQHVGIDIAYASVVMPHCPDWRTSPVTTYSNTQQGNFGCATTVNLGQMVADPRDLIRGSGAVENDAERTSAVIRNYKSGKELPSSSATSSAGASGESASGASAGGNTQ